MSHRNSLPGIPPRMLRGHLALPIWGSNLQAARNEQDPPQYHVPGIKAVAPNMEPKMAPGTSMLIHTQISSGIALESVCTWSLRRAHLRCLNLHGLFSVVQSESTFGVCLPVLHVWFPWSIFGGPRSTFDLQVLWASEWPKHTHLGV